MLGLKIDNRQGEGQATISLFFDVATPDELNMEEMATRELDTQALEQILTATCKRSPARPTRSSAN